jgi:DNA-binding HxlR family transcriptional regulator
MVMLDILGRRWALRVGWELRHGPRSFNELQRACDGVSPSVLSQRLREGLATGTIERDEGGCYRVTTDGRTLLTIMRQLDRWAERRVARGRWRTARASTRGATRSPRRRS